MKSDNSTVVKAEGSGRKQYVAPTVVVLGSLHELTLDSKVGGLCDVTCYHHGSG